MSPGGDLHGLRFPVNSKGPNGVSDAIFAYGLKLFGTALPLKLQDLKL